VRRTRSRHFLVVPVLALAPAVLTALTVVPASPASALTVDQLETALAVSAAASSAAASSAGGFVATSVDRSPGTGGQVHEARTAVRANLTLGRMRRTVPGDERSTQDEYRFAGTAADVGGTLRRITYQQKTVERLRTYYDKPAFVYVRLPGTQLVGSVNAASASSAPGARLSSFLADVVMTAPTRTVGPATTLYRARVTSSSPRSWMHFTVANTDGRLLSLRQEIDGAPAATVLATTFEYRRPPVTFPDASLWITRDQWRAGVAAAGMPTAVQQFAGRARTTALDAARDVDRPVRASDVRAAAVQVLDTSVPTAYRSHWHTTDVYRGVKIVGKNPFTGQLSVRYLRVDDGDVVISTS
jgi:hypothetical protein